MRPTLDDLTAYLNQLQDATPPDLAVLQSILDRAESQVLTVLRSLVADPSLDFNDDGDVSSVEVTGTRTSLFLTLPQYQYGSITKIEQLTTQGYVEISGWTETQQGLYWQHGWNASSVLPTMYRITAIWGYGAMPDVIAQIVLSLAVNIWRSKESGGFVDTVGVEGSGGIRAVAGLNKSDQVVLQAWADQHRQVAV